MCTVYLYFSDIYNDDNDDDDDDDDADQMRTSIILTRLFHYSEVYVHAYGCLVACQLSDVFSNNRK